MEWKEREYKSKHENEKYKKNEEEFEKKNLNEEELCEQLIELLN